MTPRPALVVVSCGGRKLPHAAPAGQMYTGSYHLACRRAADALQPDLVLILSAKWGLVGLDELVQPYDAKWTSLGSIHRSRLMMQVQRRQLGDLAPVVFLGGQDYAYKLANAWPATSAPPIVPLAGCRGIGEQLARLAAIRRTGDLPAVAA